MAKPRLTKEEKEELKQVEATLRFIFKLTRIDKFNNIIVNDGYLYGVYDRHGNEIIPLKYTNLTCSSNCYKAYGDIDKKILAGTRDSYSRYHEHEWLYKSIESIPLNRLNSTSRIEPYGSYVDDYSIKELSIISTDGTLVVDPSYFITTLNFGDGGILLKDRNYNAVVLSTKLLKSKRFNQIKMCRIVGDYIHIVFDDDTMVIVDDELNEITENCESKIWEIWHANECIPIDIDGNPVKDDNYNYNHRVGYGKFFKSNKLEAAMFFGIYEWERIRTLDEATIDGDDTREFLLKFQEQVVKRGGSIDLTFGRFTQDEDMFEYGVSHKYTWYNPGVGIRSSLVKERIK